MLGWVGVSLARDDSGGGAELVEVSGRVWCRRERE
jgi:hypothetical protein